MDYLIANIKVFNPDIIGVTESWTDDKISDAEIQIDGFVLFRQDRVVSKGGGVLLYIRDSLVASATKLENDFPEQVWCKLRYNGRHELLVGVCYRTPTETVYGHIVHEQRRDLIQEVSNRDFILMGDFNYKGIDWTNNRCDTSSVESRLFLDRVNKCFVTQHVTDLTTDNSVLDLIFSRDPDMVQNVLVNGNFHTSDHKLLSYNLNIAREPEDRTEIRYDYRRMNVNGAREELRLIKWDEVMNGTVNYNWESLKEILFGIQRKYVPVDVRSRKSKKLWLTYKALKYVKCKHRVFRKYKDSHHSACVRASRLVSREVKKAKLNFEKKLAENIKKDSKSFFAYVRGRSQATRKLGPLCDSGGNLVESSDGMSELFNEAFGKVFTKENLSDIPEAKWVFPDKGGIGLCDISFDEASVLKSLEKLRDDKAVGADELVPRFLNLIKQELACPLTILFQSIMACESVPDDRKEANVVPVYKGGSRNVASNYRPISLTSQLCKVFETIVRDQVMEFLETNVLIRNSQHGFRKGSSCLTNLLLFLDKVLIVLMMGFQ